MEGPRTSTLHRILMQEKADRDDLVKKHKQLEMLCSRLKEEGHRSKEEKEDLLASVSRFQDSFAENSKMLCTLDQAVQDLAVARQELAVSVKASAENRMKAEMLEKENTRLNADMQARGLQAEQDMSALKKSTQREFSKLQQDLLIEKTGNKAAVEQMRAQHEKQVAGLQRDLVAAMRAREEIERKLEKEHKAFQMSVGSFGTGQSDVVASLKQRMWALRSELDSTKIERDNLKRLCTRS